MFFFFLLLSKHSITHTDTNTQQATALVYLPHSALWLWERQVNTLLLYKQVGPVEPLTLFSSPQSFLERNIVSTNSFYFKDSKIVSEMHECCVRQENI